MLSLFRKKKPAYDAPPVQPTGEYHNAVTAGVWHSRPQYGDTGYSVYFVPGYASYGVTGISIGSGFNPFDNARPQHKPDWWRCDACGHAVPWQKDGQPQLSCPNCGAQLPTRYDP